MTTVKHVGAWVVARLYTKEYTTARPVSMEDLATGLAHNQRAAIPEAVADLAAHGFVVRAGDRVGLVQDLVGQSVPWAYPRLPEDRQRAILVKAPPWLREALAPPPNSKAEPEPEPEPVTRAELEALAAACAAAAEAIRASRADLAALRAEVHAAAAPPPAAADDRALRTAVSDLHGRVDGLRGRLEAWEGVVNSHRAATDRVSVLERRLDEYSQTANEARSLSLEAHAFIHLGFGGAPGVVSLARIRAKVLADDPQPCHRRDRGCAAPATTAIPVFWPTEAGWWFLRGALACDKHRLDYALYADHSVPRETIEAAVAKGPPLQVDSPPASMGVWGSAAFQIAEALKKCGIEAEL